MHLSFHVHHRTLLLLSLAASACGGGDSLVVTPLTGTLQITTSTSGVEPDSDGYTVQVDAEGAEAIGSAGSLTRSAVAPGNHAVLLAGIAPNCTVAGENPRTVSVVDGETTSITFAVTCTATTGSLQLSVATSGQSLDPDGYTVSLDGNDREVLGVNAAVTLAGLVPGRHEVALNGVAGNCQVQGDNLQAVTVVAGASVTVVFEVTCTTPPVSPGTLRITAVTTGPDQDPDGYNISLNGTDGGPLGVNSAVTLTGIVPGHHEVGLNGVAGNCQVQGNNLRAVTVVAGASVTVAFEVACTSLPVNPGTLRITTTTTGPDQDPNGYSLTLDGDDRGVLGVSDAVTLTGLVPGPHEVGLDGIAGNCQVQGNNLRAVSIIAGASVTVAFEVACTGLPVNPGTLRITTVTTGPDQDSDGYSFTVDGGSNQPIGTNAVASVTNVTPGAHTIELEEVAGNCSVQGANPRQVTLAEGATENLSFAVICSTLSGGIRITVATSGEPADADGYTVNLDGNDPGLRIEATGSVSFDGVSPGNHSVALSDVATNCGVDGEASKPVSVTAGNVSEVSFSVRCEPTGGTIRLEKVSGDAQSGPVETVLGAPLVVRVTAAAGDPIQGVTIEWTIGGGGSVSATSTVTGPDGQTSVTRRLGGTPGSQATVATAAGSEGLAVTFSHIATATNATGRGQWGAEFSTPVVAVHTHVLPTGKVLLWGDAGDAHLWAPSSGFTSVPKAYRIYCSGHTFLSDGRILVVGGTSPETRGLRVASVFDPSSSSWSAAASMAQGRYYPTTTTLPNGDVLAVSGHDTAKAVVTIPEVWNGSGWRRLTSAPLSIPDPYYPAMFVAPNGKVFLAGFQQTTRYLDVTGAGQWTIVANRNVADRTLGSAVMYAPGKILYAGGGDPPTRSAEVIDLNQPSPSWRTVPGMAFARRQMNATLLADGSVLVTGGTSGPGFNDQAGAVLAAELWNPQTESWRTMASENTRRTYHGTALLLPSGRVLSSGGGEGGGISLADSEFSAQVFSPPYLFNADGSLAVRPSITSAPSRLSYRQSFTVQTPEATSVARGTLIRLSSVTHAFNQSQLIYSLTFAANTSTSIRSVAPANANLAPPGPYMLFLINGSGVPSVAKIVTVGP